MEAAARRAQREEQRRFKELQRRAKEQAKLSGMEQARLEVDTYENRLEVLLSIHKEQGEEWNWEQVLNTPSPVEPPRHNHHEAEARARLNAFPPPVVPEKTSQYETEYQARLDAYKPGLFDRLFGRAKDELSELAAGVALGRQYDEQAYQKALRKYEEQLAEQQRLEREVVAACETDEADYKQRMEEYLRVRANWEDSCRLAKHVLAGERRAFVEVLNELSPFAEISELGSSVHFTIHSPQIMECVLQVSGEQAIPCEIKSLTSAGKISTKAMPKARFHEIYQDYVCGCVLRVGREVFALLPVETVLVTALAELFDSRTGRTAEQPILSVALHQAAMAKLNFNRLDPSDAMENFLHRGDFKASRKSGAFVPITPLTAVDLEAPQLVPGSHGAILAGTAPSLPPMTNPFPAKWAEALRQSKIEFGFLRLTANDVADLLGRAPQDNFTLTESKGIARAVENFGYCLEPDPRHGAGNFWGNREVGVFQPPSGSIQEPSENFLGASALLQLCLLVAAADGAVDHGELDQFRHFIESQFRFTPDEHQRLVVLETLLARNAASAKVTLGRTAKRVPQDKHIVIAQFLVDVAAADGVISPKEHRALARIFDALGLSTETLDTLIRNLTTADRDVVIQRAESRQPGETIPPPIKSQPAALKLDMTKVAAISAETHEVIGLLAKAMSEDDLEETSAVPPDPASRPAVSKASLASTSVTSPPTPSSIANIAANSPAAFDGLDAKFHRIVQQLAGRDSWRRTEFDAVAREHQLMTLNVIDALNEWSDQYLGDFLLEGEDPIIVHRPLLKPDP
jgi:tellurite resistance protein